MKDNTLSQQLDQTREIQPSLLEYKWQIYNCSTKWHSLHGQLPENKAWITFTCAWLVISTACRTPISALTLMRSANNIFKPVNSLNWSTIFVSLHKIWFWKILNVVLVVKTAEGLIIVLRDTGYLKNYRHMGQLGENYRYPNCMNVHPYTSHLGCNLGRTKCAPSSLPSFLDFK